MTDRLRSKHSSPDRQSSSTIVELDDPAHNGSDSVSDDGDLLEKYFELDCPVIETPRIFHDTEKAAKELKDALHSLANQIAGINQRENTEKAKGSVLSFAGSLMGITGTILAPFTLGGSLVLTTSGIAMSVRGTAVSSKAENKMTTQTNQKIGDSQTLLDAFTKQTKKWNKVNECLNDIEKDLGNLFSHLEVRLCNMLEFIEDCTYQDTSSYKVESFFKCVSNFYRVAKTSTYVVRNVEKITLLARRVTGIESVLPTGKKDEAKTATGVPLKTARGKPKFVLSVSKRILDTDGRVFTIKQPETVSQAAKIVSFAANGSSNVVKTEKAFQLFGKTITKETVTITKTVSKIGLGLGVVFAAVDLYQLGSAIKASESTCDAETELHSCIQNIKEITDQVMRQVNVYKEVMRIKLFFESLLQYGREIVFGDTDLPLEEIKFCIHLINSLHSMAT